MKFLFSPLSCSIAFFLVVQVKSAELKWNNFTNRQNVVCLFPDGEHLWIGTHDAGLVRRNITTGEELIFDKDDGFFSDQIIDIVRDSHNIIWAASPDNIACFQNNSWVVKKLFDNSVKDLTVDSSGVPWVACSNGIGRYLGDQFVKIGAFDSLKKSDEYPIVIVSGSRKNIIYTLVKNRVICCTGDGLLYKIIDIPFDTPVDICIDMDNTLFVTGVDTVGMYTNDQWSLFSVKDSSLSATVTRLSVSPLGDVWAYGVGNISVLNGNKWILRHQHTYGSGIISTVAPLTKDSAWFGRAFYLALKTHDTLKTVLSNTPGGNNIRFVFADKEGTIWTQAADDVGILQFKDGKWNFDQLFYTLHNRTTRMLQTTDSVYWFLQQRNCLNYLLKINGGVQRFVAGSDLVPSGALNDFIEDVNGNIWFATSNGVISNHDRILYNDQNTGFNSSTINTLLLRMDSTVWIGGNDGTIAFYKDSSWTMQSISIKSNITTLAEDSSGNLWIGTENGVIKKTDEKETVFTVSDGLGDNNVTKLFVDKNNLVWVGTYKGLSYFDDGILIQTFLRPSGIAGNVITSICQNRDGVLWIGTDRGISTLTLGTSAINQKKNNGPHHISKSRPHTILTISPNIKKSSPNSATYLLNGKKGPASTNLKPSQASNCYILQ